MKCLIPTDDVKCFVEWLKGLSVLGIFWAKRLKKVTIASKDPPVLILDWERSKRKAIFALCYEFNQNCLNLTEDADLLLLTASELPQGLYDRWGKVFIYDSNNAFLEPNKEVTVEVYDPSKVDSVISITEVIQRSSWGFYKPPPKGDYVVVAKLQGEAVGSAYYNPNSSNIDFGIHVARQYWRRRIGTRLLVEVAKLARALGNDWFSVVRVIRGAKPTESDKRAIAFYRANKPKQELNVYRLTSIRQIDI